MNCELFLAALFDAKGFLSKKNITFHSKVINLLFNIYCEYVSGSCFNFHVKNLTCFFPIFFIAFKVLKSFSIRDKINIG